MNKKRLALLVILAFLLLHSNQAQEEQTKYFVSHDGVTIAYVDEGSGKPVLLLHGFINSGNSWNKSSVKKKLLESGYRVIVPDLRGNGNSDQPENEEAYQNDAEVKDLIALADYLKLEHYWSIGYSRGSIVLAKLLTLDNRIQKAIIGGMGADFTNADWDRRLAFADAFRGRVEPTPLTKGAVEYATSIGANLKVLGLLQDYQPVTSSQELAKVSIPVLIICGDVDIDNGDPKELQKLIPKSQLKIVKGDHNNTYKQENFSNEALIFLKEN